MSVSLQTVPDGPEDSEDDTNGSPVDAAQLEAAEIVAAARREAEAIVAEARSNAPGDASSPLAALGNNADEIIAQVHKLITKQRTMEAEKQGHLEEIAELRRERDELVQRLTDAVVRMEELAAAADAAQAAAAAATAAAPPPPQPQPIPAAAAADGELSLAQRLARAEQEEREARAADESAYGGASEFEEAAAPPPPPAYSISADGRSFYSRHSAKLPRLEGDGGRSVLSAVTDMRPELEQKGRKRKTRRKP